MANIGKAIKTIHVVPLKHPVPEGMEPATPPPAPAATPAPAKSTEVAASSEAPSTSAETELETT